MPDKRIGQLTPTDIIQDDDNFVLEQSGQAKRITGQNMTEQLAALLDGHGGIQSISYAPPVSPSLNGTLTLTFAGDETEYSFAVANGRGISTVSWVNSGTPGDGQYHNGTIEYNDGSTSTFSFRDGVKGAQGNQTYVWFKWAQNYPTSDGDISDSVGPYIGIYAGLSSTAPSTYTSYVWYEYKGEKGDTGATIQSITKTGTSGLIDTYTILLTDGNTHTFNVTNAKSIVSVEFTSGNHAAGTTDVYTIYFNDGDSATFSVYNGANGTGSVSSVSGIQAVNGDVPQVTTGSGAPTTATVGQVNQLYYDQANSILYYCAGESAGSYIWMGAGVTVDSALSGSSENPVQNMVITAKVGTEALNTTAQNLSGAINEVVGIIPQAATTAPVADTASGSTGSGTKWAKNDHSHPINVPSSGVPANLGTASNGSASTYARSDHVHAKPTPADIGAVASTELLNKIYPIGSLYWSVVNTSPASFLGGSWVQIKDLFVMAAGDTYHVPGTLGAKVGGASSVTLASTQMPSHRHATYYQENTQNYSSGTKRRGISNAATESAVEMGTGTSYAGGNGSGRNTQGTTSAHENMPPYTVAYCWRRES